MVLIRSIPILLALAAGNRTPYQFQVLGTGYLPGSVTEFRRVSAVETYANSASASSVNYCVIWSTNGGCPGTIQARIVNGAHEVIRITRSAANGFARQRACAIAPVLAAAEPPAELDEMHLEARFSEACAEGALVISSAVWVVTEP